MTRVSSQVRSGDSLDMAVLLCALLADSGHDAYVVCGTAPWRVTLGDRSCQECPEALLRRSEWVAPESAAQSEEGEIPEPYASACLGASAGAQTTTLDAYLRGKDEEAQRERDRIVSVMEADLLRRRAAQTAQHHKEAEEKELWMRPIF